MPNLLGVFQVFQQCQKFFPNPVVKHHSFLIPVGIYHKLNCLQHFSNTHFNLRCVTLRYEL